MTYIHQSVLRKPWNGFKHIARFWYEYNDNHYPAITRIDMHRIEEDGTISECISHVSENGVGPDRLTLDDCLTGLMILIEDGILDGIL